MPKDYSSEDAQLDNCFIVNNSKANNNYIYSQFTSNYRNWISSFIRIVKTTEENNMTIYDILYDADLNKFFIVTDNTRNNSLSSNEQNISLKEFEQIGEYKSENTLYLIAFNGTFSEETFRDNNTLIITELN